MLNIIDLDNGCLRDTKRDQEGTSVHTRLPQSSQNDGPGSFSLSSKGLSQSGFKLVPNTNLKPKLDSLSFLSNPATQISDQTKAARNSPKLQRERLSKKINLILNEILDFVATNTPGSDQNDFELKLDVDTVKKPSKLFAFNMEIENHFTILTAKMYKNLSKDDSITLDFALRMIKNQEGMDKSDIGKLFKLFKAVYGVEHHYLVKTFNLLVVLGLEKLALFNHASRFFQVEMSKLEEFRR